MHHAIQMIGRRVQRIELERHGARIDNVVSCTGRHYDRETGVDGRVHTIDDRFAVSLLNAKELIERVDLRTDLFLWFQRHDDKLAVLGRIQYLPECCVRHGDFFDILDVPFHVRSLAIGEDGARHVPGADSCGCKRCAYPFGEARYSFRSRSVRNSFRPMPITVGETLKASTRAAWREWLIAHHADKREVWLIADDRPDVPTVDYLDAVEEALCFGWIDSIAKRLNSTERVQRFSPRRAKSNWTELNKARARRLIALGLMTDAGRATLPDLDVPFVLADDIRRALVAAGAWDFFAEAPPLYQRVRAGYVEEQRRVPLEFTKRLNSLIEKSAAGKLFGGWNDGGRLVDAE